MIGRAWYSEAHVTALYRHSFACQVHSFLSLFSMPGPPFFELHIVNLVSTRPVLPHIQTYTHAPRPGCRASQAAFSILFLTGSIFKQIQCHCRNRSWFPGDTGTSTRSLIQLPRAVNCSPPTLSRCLREARCWGIFEPRNAGCVPARPPRMTLVSACSAPDRLQGLGKTA